MTSNTIQKKWKMFMMRRYVIIMAIFTLVFSPITMHSFLVYAENGEEEVGLTEENEVVENETPGHAENDSADLPVEEEVEEDTGTDAVGEENERKEATEPAPEEAEEEETNEKEEQEKEETTPTRVTPVLPKVTQASCDENGNPTRPTIEFTSTPIEEGIIYEIAGVTDVNSLKAGDTVTILAAAYDRTEEEELILAIPDGWVDVGDNMAKTEIELEIPDCSAEKPKDDQEGEDTSVSEDEESIAKGLGEGEILDITRKSCTVSIKTDLGAGDYVLNVWDDGQLEETITHSMEEAGEHVFTWTIQKPAKEGAPGVAFALHDQENEAFDLDFVDPYEYPREVAQKCSGEASTDDPVVLDKEVKEKDSSDNIGKKVKKGTKVIAKEEAVKVTAGDTLPSTATSLFNVLLIGAGIVLLGGVLLFIFRRKAT